MGTSVRKVSQNGFTLIEVMLVLGISGLLLLITFFGQGSVRTQSQFRDAVEEFRASLEKIKDNVNTGVSANELGCAGSGAGRNEDCIQYGRAVTFDNNSSDYTITPLVGNGPSISKPLKTVPVEGLDIRDQNASDNELLWGAQFTDLDGTAIVFTRHSGTGELQTHAMSESALLTATPANVSALFNNSAGVEHTIQIQGVDCDGANVIINDPINTIRIEHVGKLC